MTKETPRVMFDVDARHVEGTILSARPSSTGLLKIHADTGNTIVRHVDCVRAMNDAAKAIIETKETT